MKISKLFFSYWHCAFILSLASATFAQDSFPRVNGKHQSIPLTLAAFLTGRS
jgi:hypothetical protein